MKQKKFAKLILFRRKLEPNIPRANKENSDERISRVFRLFKI